MLTSQAWLVPHLPTLVVDEHRGHRTAMLGCLAEASDELRAETAVAAVVLSARWDSPGAFLVDAGRRHRTLTDYSGFGVEVRYDCPGHPALARALVDAGQKAGLRVVSGTRGADSGVSVPMHFLAPRGELAIVPLSLAHQEPPACRAWGRVLRAALASWSERVVFVVGGMLSYDLHAWGLRREVPETTALDQSVIESFRAGEWPAFDPGLAERAHPEASLRHLEVLRGFVGDGVRGELRCYESGPGVGAALVSFPLEPRVAVPAEREAGANPAP